MMHLLQDVESSSQNLSLSRKKAQVEPLPTHLPITCQGGLLLSTELWEAQPEVAE